MDRCITCGIRPTICHKLGMQGRAQRSERKVVSQIVIDNTCTIRCHSIQQETASRSHIPSQQKHDINDLFALYVTGCVVDRISSKRQAIIKQPKHWTANLLLLANRYYYQTCCDITVTQYQTPNCLYTEMTVASAHFDWNMRKPEITIDNIFNAMRDSRHFLWIYAFFIQYISLKSCLLML